MSEQHVELPESTKEAIRRLVASAPLPTEEQLSKLRRLMRPGFEAAAAEDQAAEVAE